MEEKRIQIDLTEAITTLDYPKPNSDGKLFGWSPDGGEFVQYKGKTYWHTGQVTTGAIFRMGYSTHANDYSAWSSRKRQKTLAAFKKKWAANKRAEERHHKKIDRLVKQAEAKLTEEEIQAMAEHYRY